jgi:hypothetical protein
MIDVKLTKENALPFDLWGLISETWKPSPENGVTVFLQGLEKRGPDNRRNDALSCLRDTPKSSFQAASKEVRLRCPLARLACRRLTIEEATAILTHRRWKT